MQYGYYLRILCKGEAFNEVDVVVLCSLWWCEILARFGKAVAVIQYVGVDQVLKNRSA